MQNGELPNETTGSPSPVDVPVRNPRHEAEAVAGGAARVLEPSPPAVIDDEWFADDPTAIADADGTVVSPIGVPGGSDWSNVAAENPTTAAFVAKHWLGSYRSLPAVPEGFAELRDDFHRLAYAVVAQARHDANGKFGLRYTLGGFGTPFFGDDTQVRVSENHIVLQGSSGAKAVPITTLRAAGTFVGVEPGSVAAEHDSPELGDLDRPLVVSKVANNFLGEWFGFAASVMEHVRRIQGAADAGRVQLWPGHFDVAVEVGSSDAGQRATYGASPGDAAHDEPYLYVGAWGDVDRTNPFWNEKDFNGASLAFAELMDHQDQHAAALNFFTTAHRLLTS